MFAKIALTIGLLAFPLAATIGSGIAWRYEPCTMHYDPDALQDFPYDCYGACYGGSDCKIAGAMSEPACSL